MYGKQQVRSQGEKVWGSGGDSLILTPCLWSLPATSMTHRKWREGPEGRDKKTYFLGLLCSLDAWVAGSSKGKGRQFGRGNAIEENGNVGPTVGLSATSVHWEPSAGGV